MPSDDRPLQLSRLLVTGLGTRVFTFYGDRVPLSGSVLLVSNHRSFMDAPLLMAATGRTVRFACHHYMGRVPGLREVVEGLGCFPLEAPQDRHRGFFRTASRFLRAQECVGVFPEGTQPMVSATDPRSLCEFQRGFAHLALRSPVKDLAVLPVAIASQAERRNTTVPLRMLSWIDPSEPLFDQPGWHPMVVYERVNVLVGRPRWITPQERSRYQNKQGLTTVQELTDYCQGEIEALLAQGCC